MKPWVRISLYALLTILTCIFAFQTKRNYSRLMREQGSSENDPDEKLNASARAKIVEPDLGRLVEFGLVFVLSVAGLGVMVAHDVSRYLGQKAVNTLFNDEGEGMKVPEYEIAEEQWANGKFLEAIQTLRDYLQKNPREQHAALRIAEIYEKDLQNYLAAALEYEEVLKTNIDPERWGWAAIHLANLYSGKLSKPEKSVEILRRIVAEYGQTAAAKKARERLSQLEPEEGQATSEMAEGMSFQPSEPPSASNLPPGFLPKKS